MAKAVRGAPVRPRPPATPPGRVGGNYFASVVEELRKVVWPTWNELGRMTGVVVTTVILMAAIVSAADYAIGFFVKQLYSSNTASVAGSQQSAQPSVAPSRASANPTRTAPPASSAPASVAPAPVPPAASGAASGAPATP